MPIVRRALLALSLAILAGASPRRPRIQVISGSQPDGRATDLWLAILRHRLSPAAFDSVAGLRRLRTAHDEAWARLILDRSVEWPGAAEELEGLFDSTRVDSMRVVLGDRGAEDAFTHDSLTMGFDLSALQRVYGDAARAGNGDLLDRLFRHEFTHLLQKRWLARHPVVPTGPLEAALLDEWEEGLGNFYSLSARWRATAQGPSPAAAAALAELEPRFVARMSALACAESTSAGVLLAGLSSGPFTQKWGALPVALWLEQDAEAEPDALHRFAGAGPTAVWVLAARHLPGALADSLAAARRRARSC